MPPLYVAAHLLLCLACAGLVLACARQPRARSLFVAGLAVTAGLGLLLERRTDWAWSAMLLGWPDAVFFTDLTAEAMSAVAALLWLLAGDRNARRRAVLLGGAGLAAALCSYAWFFRPLPAGLGGTADETGYCQQTTEDSCSAAAVVMLLASSGIPSTEAEVARLALTRERLGTPPLGLYRAVALKTKDTAVKPSLQVVDPRRGLPHLHCPVILSVGVERFAPAAVQQRMRQYGWAPGVKHAILVTAADPQGAWIDVADPSYGRERWPTEHLEELWDGRALALVPR